MSEPVRDIRGDGDGTGPDVLVGVGESTLPAEVATSVPAAEPAPLGVALPTTGHPEVDALLTRLEDADILPTEDHIEVYEDVHRGLRDALTALDHNNRS